MAHEFALGIKVNALALNQSQAATLHCWTVGLDEDSEPEFVEAARRDFVEIGGQFAMLRGAVAYQLWLKHSWPALPQFALTQAMGSADWWDEALDRVWGVCLYEAGCIGSVGVRGWRVPEPAPRGLDYRDLVQGQLRATGITVRERCGAQASGGFDETPLR